MPIELIIATVAISLALLFYTWGVFGERRHGSLSLKYVLLFWAGLTCDTTGTLIMSNIASQSNVTGFGIHGITGALAIVCAIGTAIVIVGLLAAYLFARDRNDDKPRKPKSGHNGKHPGSGAALSH